MRTKSIDRIKLSNGDEMTMGEAFDRGLVTTGTTIGRGRNCTVSIHYLAKEVESGCFWEIGQKFFESRGGVPDPKHVKAREDSKR
jgi:hypothetical protein